MSITNERKANSLSSTARRRPILARPSADRDPVRADQEPDRTPAEHKKDVHSRRACWSWSGSDAVCGLSENNIARAMTRSSSVWACAAKLYRIADQHRSRVHRATHGDVPDRPARGPITSTSRRQFDAESPAMGRSITDPDSAIGRARVMA